MSLPIVIRPRADWELDDIVAWIADRDQRAAHRFRQKVEETFEQIARFPQLGSRSVTPEGTFWLRQVRRYKRFVIIYQITDERIDVLRIIRASRGNKLLPGD